MLWSSLPTTMLRFIATRLLARVVRAVDAALAIGHGPEVARRPGDGIDPAGRNLVAGKGLLDAARKSGWVVDAGGKTREVSAAFGQRWHRGQDRVARSLPCLLPTD